MLGIRKLNSQKGLTLVEVLAALVILGILFVGIMTVFPQMTLFNNKTEAKLDTMNLARQEMTKITSHTYNSTELTDLSVKLKEVLNKKEDGSPIHTPNPYSIIKSDTSTYSNYSIFNSKSKFPYDLHVYKMEDLSGTISLYKVILQIKTSSSNPNSETYGYIEVKAGGASP